jgi:NADH-quinone oxidoreductase subunit C
MTLCEEIERLVRSRFSEAVEESSEVQGILNLVVREDAIIELCRFLKESPDLHFDYLMSLTAVDWPDRFDVVYHLYSIAQKHYVTLKVRLGKENPALSSVEPVWRAAEWQEREVYDMFGIEFEGNPDMRRILLEPDWEGFPLRKDYEESPKSPSDCAGEESAAPGTEPRIL